MYIPKKDGKSESNSEREEKTNLYLSEKAGLTPLSAMTQSLETVIGWLSKKKKGSSFLLFVTYSIIQNIISSEM